MPAFGLGLVCVWSGLGLYLNSPRPLKGTQKTRISLLHLIVLNKYTCEFAEKQQNFCLKFLILGRNMLFELHLVKFVIKTLVGYQFVVGAHFFDFALIEHYYFARLANG